MNEKNSTIWDTLRRQAWSLIRKPPSFTEARLAFKAFSLRQKSTFVALALISIFSVGLLVWLANQRFLVTIKESGGSLTEGIVGSPRFINPLLAISDADRDLVPLIYSGLMRPDPNGNLIPDLAQSVTVSADNLTYTFKLKPNLKWQDNVPLTADDVVFTVQEAQDPSLRSVKRANWEGVTVRKIDSQTVQFTLKKPYAAFLLNTTIGILPQHLWKNLNADSFSLSDLNSHPIGSGPYEIKNITKDSSGIPQAYELAPFNGFALGKPWLEKVTLKFYDNQQDLVDAYLQGGLDSLAVTDAGFNTRVNKNTTQVIQVPLPRLFAVFFNQNRAQIFTHKEVRQALSMATDREALVKEVLDGEGQALSGVFPPGTFGYEATAIPSPDFAGAKALLQKNGWSLNTQGVMQKAPKAQKNKNGKIIKAPTGSTETLSFTLATVNLPELKATAEKLKNDWSKIGVQVDVQIYEPSDLNQNVIRTRHYDALLFGEIIGRDSDPFPFWHSSQRLDPGLNIAMYTNTTADKLLEDARTIADPNARKAKYLAFAKEIQNDTPAVFLYAPDFVYYLPRRIQGVDIPNLTVPSERFLNIYNWYEKTDRVWRLFAKPDEIISTH